MTILVYKTELLQELSGMTDSKAEDFFGDEVTGSLRKFWDMIEVLTAIPRSENDVAVKPILRGTGTRRSLWICPECGCEVGDIGEYSTQTHGDYCPDCGMRLDWPAVSNRMLRSNAFIRSADIDSILDTLAASEDEMDGALSEFLRTQLHGKEEAYKCRMDRAIAPTLKSTHQRIMVDYMDGTGGPETVEVEEHGCPVCGWFVDSHDFPFLYTLPGANMGKKKPCRFCMHCGQKIDWGKADLDPEKYELPTIVIDMKMLPHTCPECREKESLYWNRDKGVWSCSSCGEEFLDQNIAFCEICGEPRQVWDARVYESNEPDDNNPFVCDFCQEEQWKEVLSPEN